MVPAVAPVRLRAASRLVVLAALVVLVAVAVLPAPAQAQHTSPILVGRSVPDRGYDADENGGFGLLDDALDWEEPARSAREQFQEGNMLSTFVSGTTAGIRTDGKATIPRGAPERVRALLSHLNRIVGKRYTWGGGHAKLADKGYDCSGAVSYGLIRAGLLAYSMVSGRFTRWGKPGGGRWVTIYANKRHVYMEVAGLRLDTSAVGDQPALTGVRWRPVIGQRNGFTVRHLAGL
ncbi:MAG: hypothetical protein QOF69_3443 [Solirubrobacteraceae bacterium]|nr:hypothetical protein [Solirubrobacteraceae bacterium]